MHRLHRFYAKRNFDRLHRFFAFLAKAHPDGLKSRHDSNLCNQERICVIGNPPADKIRVIRVICGEKELPKLQLYIKLDRKRSIGRLRRLKRFNPLNPFHHPEGVCFLFKFRMLYFFGVKGVRGVKGVKAKCDAGVRVSAFNS